MSVGNDGSVDGVVGMVSNSNDQRPTDPKLREIFPRATGDMRAAGWTIAPEYLQRLHDHIEALPEHWGVAEEGIEEVLLAIEAIGNGHTYPRSGAYAPTATCRHGIHPYDCREGCDPHRMVP